MSQRQRVEWASEMLMPLTWRCLIHHHHFLMYRVHKARYSTTCSFLKANRGNNPFYEWRSLPQARDVILEGSVWKIGDGTIVEIEKHRWLPRPPCFRRVGARPLLVKELVDEGTKQWDHDKIAHWFEPLTCKDILCIPLNNVRNTE